jgi:dolichol-phosphate mannosyltransferase
MRITMTLSVILPCYNEEANIAASVKDVASWMKNTAVDGQIIVVDDGSKDHSVSILEELTKTIPHLHIVRHTKNGGYGIAVRSGCDAATTDWIAFMDSDGQFQAKDLDLLLAYTNDYDFITGRRAHRADSFMRNMFGKVLGGMNVLVLGLWVRDVNCGMKLPSRYLENYSPNARCRKTFQHRNVFAFETEQDSMDDGERTALSTFARDTHRRISTSNSAHV